MITPELENYVKQARAQGMNDAQIRQNLLSGGWSEADLTQAGLAPSFVPPSAPSAMPQVESVITVNPEQIQQAKKTGSWAYILVFIIFLILGATGGYFFYKSYNEITKMTGNESVVIPQPEIIPVQDNEFFNPPINEEIIPPVSVDTEAEITPPPAPVCLAVPTGLVAWYAGDDNAKDIKNANDGVLKGGVKYIAGVVGQAFSLNGTDAFVQVSSSALNDPTISGSLSVWVKFNSLPSASHIMQIIGKGGNGTDFDLQANKDDKFHFYVGTGTHVGSTTVIKTGIWYYVVGTWDSAAGMKIYVNGVLENTNTVKVSRKTSGQKLEIGHQPVFPGRFLNGVIDEAEVYNRALDVSEISGISEAGSAGHCKPEPAPAPTEG